MRRRCRVRLIKSVATFGLVTCVDVHLCFRQCTARHWRWYEVCLKFLYKKKMSNNTFSRKLNKKNNVHPVINFLGALTHLRLCLLGTQVCGNHVKSIGRSSVFFLL